MITNPHWAMSGKFRNLQNKFSLVSDLLDGSEAMRLASTSYLSKFPDETPQNYARRLEWASVDPLFERTIKSGVGKAFTKPMQVVVPAPLEEIVDNADGSGTSLETFAKELMRDAIAFGVTYLLTDYPVITPNSTLADERQMGAFPYFVNIRPTQVLDLKVGFISGLTQLTHFRFLETVYEIGEDTVTEKAIQQVKCFDRAEDGTITYSIWRKTDDKEYLYDTNIISGISLIPIAPVYGNKISNFMGSPTLYELAEMTLQLWRKESSYHYNVDITSTPMLVVTGTIPTNEDGTPVRISITPNSAINLPDHTSKIEWLESNGSAASQSITSIDHLRQKMQQSGLELSMPRATGAETATGRMLDAAEANSMLKSIALDLEWSLYRAIMTAGMFIGVDATETRVEINSDYTVASSADMDMILKLLDKGVISNTQTLAEARARGMLMSGGLSEENQPNIEPVT